MLGLLIQHSYAVGWLIAIASVGNILGSCVNWYLGLKIEQFKNKKWFPVSAQKMQQALGLLSKIWLLVIVAQLDTNHWRSNYLNCWSIKRKFLAVFSAGKRGKNWALSLRLFDFLLMYFNVVHD